MIYLAGLAIIFALLFLLFLLTRGQGGIFHAFSSSGRLTSEDRKKIAYEWEKIKKLSSLGKPSQMKDAIITADKLLDHALKIKYPKAETLVERYKAGEEHFLYKKDYDSLWFAHKTRNELVHNIDFELPYAQGVDVIHIYEKSLRIMEILD